MRLKARRLLALVAVLAVAGGCCTSVEWVSQLWVPSEWPDRTPAPPPTTPISGDTAARLGKLRCLASRYVKQIAYAPDGCLLAVANSGGLSLYDAASLSELGVLSGGYEALSCAFSPDGENLVAGTATHRVQMWRLSGEKLLRSWVDPGGAVYSVAFSPDGATIASGAWDGQVRLWRARDGALQRTLQAHTSRSSFDRPLAAGVLGLAYSSDGTILASASRDGTLRVWRTADGALQNDLAPQGPVTGLALWPDGATLAASCWIDAVVQYWDLRGGAPRGTPLELPARPAALALSPDGAVLAVAAGDRLDLWRTSDGSLVRTLSEQADGVLAMAFSPNGATLAWATQYGVRLSRIGDGALLATVDLGMDRVFSVALSPDSRLAASGGEDGKVRLWRISDGALLRALAGHTGEVYGLAFSPDGTMLASASADYTVRLWRVRDGALVHTLDHSDVVMCVAFSPDGAQLASGGWDGAKLWSMPNGAFQREFGGEALGLSFSPDGTILAVAEYSHLVRLYRVSDGNVVQTLRGHTDQVRSVAFAPDGATIASGSLDSTVRLWRVSDGTQLLAMGRDTKGGLDLPSPNMPSGWDLGTWVAFSPSGSVLASAGGPGSVLRLWRVADGKQLLQVLAGGDRITGLALSGNGAILASSSLDRTVCLWGVR